MPTKISNDDKDSRLKFSVFITGETFHLNDILKNYFSGSYEKMVGKLFNNNSTYKYLNLTCSDFLPPNDKENLYFWFFSLLHAQKYEVGYLFNDFVDYLLDKISNATVADKKILGKTYGFNVAVEWRAISEDEVSTVTYLTSKFPSL